MLRSLSRGERPITEIAEPHDMSLPAVSKHVKVLERARLVKRRKSGSFAYLRLNGKAMRTADQWIEFYRKFWEDRLDALAEFLENTKTKEK
jgi:DNA-binding transcriptional ArsR family regulator